MARFPPPLPPDQLLAAELPRIEAVIAYVCRKGRCRPEDVEEFASRVKLKLVEDDYAVLRQFQGKASLKTYLTMVVTNLFRDFCNHLWGKWRSSAEAVRLGPVAEKLEELLRDGLSVDMAGEILRGNHHVELSPAQLAAMAARLPLRQPRRFVGEESLHEIADEELGPEERLLAKERELERHKVIAALTEAVAELPRQDRVIVKLRIEKGFRLADIARTLCLHEKGIYRDWQRIAGVLRAALERKGVARDTVGRALGLSEKDAPTGRTSRDGSVH